MTVPADVRDRLAALGAHWGDKGDARALLTSDEVAGEPLKWLKYLVMDRVGVEPIDKVAEQIHRFRLPDVERARSWAVAQVSAGGPAGRMVVAKVVPWDRGAQLANYRMVRRTEVTTAFEAIQTTYAGLEHELWCCDSSVGDGGCNLGGRLSYPDKGRPQVLELVWYGSPRMIETVHVPGFSHPYLKASRDLASARLEIDVLHIPTRFASSGTDEDVVLADLRTVLRELGTRARSMTALVAAVRAVGAKEVCFCFKVSDGRLTVIDWDTEMESSAR